MSRLDELAQRARSLVSGQQRQILGITGPPGAGKSTLATRLVARLTALPNPDSHRLEPWVAHLPMDGFHLADVQLDRLRLREHKGTPETFDAAGYLATLERLLSDQVNTIYAPGFERNLEQPLAAAIAVPPEATLVITEGNYLLLEHPPWNQIRELLSEVWYVDIPDEKRRERLIQRHVEFGKTSTAAQQWVNQTDEKNARLVANTKHQADLIVHGY